MKKLMVATLLGVVIFWLGSFFFSSVQAKLLGIVAFLIFLWSSEALPLGVVSLLPLLLFPTFKIINLKALAPSYAKPIIFLFLGGFLLALGMQKSGLHKWIAAKLLAIFPKSVTGVVYALAATSALLSAVLSNTTVTIMLMPIALFLSDEAKLRFKYLLATAYGASIGGILTPIGTPPNLILMGFLEDVGLRAPAFVEWIALVAPVVFGMLLFVPWYLSRDIKDYSVGCYEEIPSLTPQQKKLGLWLLLLTLLLVLNAKMGSFYPGLGLNEKLLLLGFGLALFLPGMDILEWRDTKDIPYEIIFLFGAGFAIAAAFIKTGLALSLAKLLLPLGSLPLALVLFFVALFVSFSTEITSNTALTSVALPIFYEFSQKSSLPPELILFTTTIAASYAFMLPIATPPNAIVMSSGVIKIKDMAKIGFWINLFGVVLVTIVGIVLWRGYFG